MVDFVLVVQEMLLSLCYKRKTEMKTDKIIFNSADDMATVLRAGATVVDESGVCYEYIDSVLNPYRFEDMQKTHQIGHL